MENIEFIKKTITELLEKMNFKGEVSIDSSDKDNILVNISTDEAGFLIGQAGVNLDALQYLSRVLISKKSDKSVQFLLDINDYRKNRINFLKELAGNISKQALLERAAITLQPMPAHERRIIHLALVDHPEINTESIGDESERRIVIKPIK
ncbi:KH domain-containing protein [Patescibacteria group bacterium]|nr:KH domain-containing protein [Patescibacteria group bacterium]